MRYSLVWTPQNGSVCDALFRSGTCPEWDAWQNGVIGCCLRPERPGRQIYKSAPRLCTRSGRSNGSFSTHVPPGLTNSGPSALFALPRPPLRLRNPPVHPPCAFLSPYLCPGDYRHECESRLRSRSSKKPSSHNQELNLSLLGYGGCQPGHEWSVGGVDSTCRLMDG